MKRRFRFSDLHFASKILVLMGLMGLIAVLATAYALYNMQAVNQRYRSLIAHEAQGALTIAEAARHLDSASRLAYKVLTEPDELRMLASLRQLHATQSQYDAQLLLLEEVLPTKIEDIRSIAAQSQRLFESAAEVISAAARWRGDRALQIIHREFEPALGTIRANMDDLREGAISDFETAAAQSSEQTARTIVVTALAILGSLVLVIPLALHMAITQMSRPISKLTHTMERMSQRHYDDTIAFHDRDDEVGQMAKALQVFQRSMQREDRLTIEVAASAQARRLSEQLVDLISAIPGAVFQMQMAPDGLRRILFASEKAAQLHGRTTAELTQTEEPAGHEFLYASCPEVRKAHAAFVRSVNTLVPLNFDTQTTHDGKTRWLQTLATARRTPNGGALFNGVWLDVTEQKEHGQALTRAKNIAEKAAEDKARFLATMSHEIRTPLNAMLGMTQLALRYESEEPQRERIKKTLRAGRHLLSIVNDVLDISKIEAGKMALEAEAFAPREWLTDLEELFCPEAQAKGLNLQVHLAPTTPERVRGDPQRMSQIAINYLNNAIKFTQTGDITLLLDTVENSASGVFLRCQVTDTGMGIDERDQASLFTAFEQGDSSITRRFGGSGLGLFISRQLAELMGGAAGVSSTVGTGSTFWFTARVDVMPAHTPAPANAGTEVVDRPMHSPYRSTQFARGARVLLVDDNELNRAVAHGMLEVGGILVDEACDGTQAIAMLEAASEDTYALVLMDMQMPIMDGLTATTALRQNPRFAQLPIIALTANASDDDIARTRAAGMQDHLSKPLLEETLWCCMRRWVQLPKSPAPAPLVRVDVDRLVELHETLGPVRTNTLMVDFLQDCERRLARIEALTKHAHSLEWGALAQDAHDLSGSAGSFGLTQLGDLAYQLSTLAEQRDEAGARIAITAFLKHARMDLAALKVHNEKQVFSHRPAVNT